MVKPFNKKVLPKLEQRVKKCTQVKYRVKYVFATIIIVPRDTVFVPILKTFA